MSLEQSRQNETAWLDLMEQDLGEKSCMDRDQLLGARSAGQLSSGPWGNLRDVGAYPSFFCSEGQGIWSIYHHHPLLISRGEAVS